MKKTLTIALGGRSYTIEEDAYQKLDAYLSGLRKRFGKDPSLEELMNDIESSIAEKFDGMLGKQRTVVTATDVAGMITVMGAVEEIAYDEDAPSKHEEEKKDDEKTGTASKRLYRNPDDIVIGGVCSGIAAYFGTDPAFIRILFVVLAFINGLGIFAYIILWIAIPEAATSAQKLEMRGKPVNLSELQELVKEKAKFLETEGRSAWERVQEKGKAAAAARREPVVGAVVRTGSVLSQVIRGFFVAISSIIGVILCISSGIAMAVLTATTAILLLNPGSPTIISDLPLAELAGNPWYYMAVASGYFIVLFPLIFLCLLGSTFIRRKQAFRPGPATAMAILWGISLTAGFHAVALLEPWAQERIEQAQAAQTTTRDVSVSEFQRIAASHAVELHVKRGETYAVSFTGRPQDLDRLHASVADGTLKIDQENARRPFGICVFCVTRPVKGEITLPDLDHYEARDATRTQIEGFEGDITFSVRDVARVEAVLTGQHVTSTVRDVSRLALIGNAETLFAEVRDASRLVAEELETQRVTVSTRDVGRANVWPVMWLDAEATDASRITYRGTTAETSIRKSDVANVTEE